MERQYYVETEHETSETSSPLEAASIAAEWIKRGYEVMTVVVDITDEAIAVVDDAGSSP